MTRTAKIAVAATIVTFAVMLFNVVSTAYYFGKMQGRFETLESKACNK